MAEYKETYLVNASQIQEVIANNATIVPPISLTSSQNEILTLRGMVYGKNGSSQTVLSNAFVVLYDSAGTALGSASTNSEGTYTLTFMGERHTTYYVAASYTGYEYDYDTISFTNSDFAALSFLLLPNSQIKAVYGNVVDQSGQGIAGATIYIFNSDFSVLAATMADGYFVAYDSFTSGTTYTVTVSKLGFAQSTQSFTFPSNSDFAKITIILTPTTANLTTIMGRVIIADSSPTTGIPNAFVGLFLIGNDKSETLIASQQTDDFGYYAFSNVAGGNQYIIRSVKFEAATS